MPKNKLAVASGKLRKLIHRGTDPALLETRRKGQDYRTSSTSSPNSDHSPRVSRESSLRRSSLTTLEDNGQGASSGGGGTRRITVGSIFPSTSSLEGTSNHSVSLSSLTIGSDCMPSNSTEHQVPMDRNVIICVTKDVQNFLAAASNLKEALSLRKYSQPDASKEYDDSCDDLEQEQYENARRHLVELTRVVKAILAHHQQGMRSTAITDAIRNLADAFNDGNSVDRVETWARKCIVLLDHLTDTFTTSIYEYMQGDSEDYVDRRESAPKRLPYPSNSLSNLMKGFSKSHDNLTLAAQFQDGSKQTVSEEFVTTLDQAMLTRADAINLTMTNCKHRLKYLRTVTGYLRKRAQIESDYFRHLDKLGRQTKEVLQDLQTDSESSMPLLDVFCESIDADVHFGKMSDTTFNLQVGHKLTEPLSRKNNTNQVKMKELKENWNKEQKKLNEAKSILNASRQKYFGLSREIVKTRLWLQDGPVHKVEKKRKELQDLEAKFTEVEGQYRRLVEEANACQYQVHTAQKSILCALRRLIVETDQMLMMGYENYFNIQHRFFQQFPKSRQALREKTVDFEAGRDFHDFIVHHMEVPPEPRDFYFEEINLEDLITEAIQLNRASGAGSTGSSDSQTSVPPVAISNPILATTSNLTPNGVLQNGIEHTSKDSEVTSPLSASPYRLSAAEEGSPLREVTVDVDGSSPVPQRSARNKKPRPQSFYGNASSKPQKEGNFWKGTISNLTSQKGIASSVSDIRTLQSMAAVTSEKSSKSAKSHKFRKLEAPARCKECDTLVYFDGVECDMCGLVVHQRCMESLAIICGTKLMKRKLSMFGVDLQKHLEATNRNLPILVCTCISEIERRAINVQGIYRLSGSKKKLEKLCQLFETAADRLDLSDQNPHLVASLLKNYLRRLPDPLMTFDLYRDFMALAKESLHLLPVKEDAGTEAREDARDLLNRLKSALSKLPPENYMTLLCLIYHLKNVASCSSTNLMPASNLSIVFGPNLLKSSQPQNSLEALADMTYQAKMVEVMVDHVAELFKSSEAEVWAHASRETDGKEMYIPIELSEQSHPIDEMDESDEDLDTDTPLNTPPDRRLSNLDDLNTIILNFGLEEFLGGGGGTLKHSSGSISDSSIVLGGGGGGGTLPDHLDVVGRGSGRKSNLSLQRILTPVGEELAPSQAPPSSDNRDKDRESLPLLGEVGMIVLSDYDSDSDCGPSGEGSLFSMPLSDLGDTTGPASTISLPVLPNMKSSSVSPDIFLDMDSSSGLPRKEKFRNARRKDRMAHRAPLIASSLTDDSRAYDHSSEDKVDDSPPLKSTLKGLDREPSERAEKEETDSFGISSPVRGDFLSSSTSADITPEHLAGQRHRTSLSSSLSGDRFEDSSRTCQSTPEHSTVPPTSPLGMCSPSPLDLDGDFFKRDDKSRIGVRGHSYPPRVGKVPPYHSSTDPTWRWNNAQTSNESSLSPSNLEDLIDSDLTANLDDTGARAVVASKDSEQVITEPEQGIVGPPNERESLSERSGASIHQLVTPDSGNESTHTGDTRGSSSEGDLLEAVRQKPLLAGEIECDDDGIGDSPCVKKEEFFRLQSEVWEGSSELSDHTHTRSTTKDSVLSDSSIDIEILDQQSSEDTNSPGTHPEASDDALFPSQSEDDQTSTECNRSDDQTSTECNPSDDQTSTECNPSDENLGESSSMVNLEGNEKEEMLMVDEPEVDTCAQDDFKLDSAVSDSVFLPLNDEPTSTTAEDGSTMMSSSETLLCEVQKEEDPEGNDESRPHSSSPVKQVAMPTMTLRSLGSQSQSLQRADLFADTFANEGKVAYSSFQSRPPPVSKSFLDRVEFGAVPKAKERSNSEADLLMDRLKAMGTQPVNDRIRQWREREMRTTTKRTAEGAALREKTRNSNIRQRKTQSCYDIDLTSSNDSDHHSSPLYTKEPRGSLDDIQLTHLDVLSLSLEEHSNSKQLVQKMEVRVRRSPSFQNESSATSIPEI